MADVVLLIFVDIGNVVELGDISFVIVESDDFFVDDRVFESTLDR